MTQIFVSSAASLQRVRALTDVYAAGSGAKVNLAKSSVMLCGRWTRQWVFTLFEGGVKILAVRFYPELSAEKNWEAKLAVVRQCLGRWAQRRASLTAKVLAVKVVLLSLLLHLGYLFPVSARVKLALTRAVFGFLWGGGYEYVQRELMYMPVEKGGQDVVRVPLKLDVLFSSLACRVVVEKVAHKCYFLRRYYLAWLLRHLVPIWNAVPRAGVLPPVYRAVVLLLRRDAALVTREVILDHRAWYKALVARQFATPTAVPLYINWGLISAGRAPGEVRDLQWRCALGRLPVSEVLHRHGCSWSWLRPRACGGVETMRHAFWVCPFAAAFWRRVQGQFRRAGWMVRLS